MVGEDGAKLATYKYPRADGTSFKGVIFFIHGFQSYSNRVALMAKSHSDLGYDFYAMDLRGHGKSDGQTALIPSLEGTVKEFQTYHKKVLEQYEDTPPVYLMGNSFGCMVSMHILMHDAESIPYKAAHFIGPFFMFNQT